MRGLRIVEVTRYVTPLREGGSLPAIVEADDDGLYVLKFRGAGQGARALVAELVSGEIARMLRRRRVSAEHTYDYAIIRVVPRVERGEQINAGVILLCPDLDFLEARIELDEAALLALDPTVDLEPRRANLATIPAVCRGGPDAGPTGSGWRVARKQGAGSGNLAAGSWKLPAVTSLRPTHTHLEHPGCARAAHSG